jgi:glycosyltransferase involved in cell wall biosynthesis
LRILHVSPYFMPANSYGGPVESLYRLCLNLARVGCDVRVLTTNADGRKVLDVRRGREVAVAAGFEVTYMGRIGGYAFSPGLLIRLLSEVRRAQVVHLTGVYAFTTLPTLLLCRLMRRPLVWSPRGALLSRRGGRGRLLKRLWQVACRVAAPRATMLHLTSETERAESLRRFPNFSTTVVPNAVRVPASVNHTAAADGTLRLGYIGRLHPRKGINNLLEACRIVKGQGIACSLVIAGTGRARYTRFLRRKIDALGLASAVRMAGEVHGSAKRAFFEALDLLVAPAHAESFGTAVAEGLAFGVPVIASRHSPWARLEDQSCGLWVDDDPESLANAIMQMRAMPLEQMGQRGREWMSAEFTWDSAAREVCDAYSMMLSGAPILGQTAGARDSIDAARQSAPRP